MRPIDADALVKDGYVLHRTYQQDEKTMVYETKRIEDVPTVQIEPHWIPFTTRQMTKEEKEEHSEWGSILDCKLPDDGQQILVSINIPGHERVQYDEFYMDDGSYLDSGCEIGTEAVAWMPFPEPYKEGES